MAVHPTLDRRYVSVDVMQTWHPDDDAVRAKWPNIERVSAVLRNDYAIKALNDYYDMWT